MVNLGVPLDAVLKGGRHRPANRTRERYSCWCHQEELQSQPADRDALGLLALPELDLRPVYHRKEQRIRSHVLLCWLALLLVRLAENATGETWRNLRFELEKCHLVRFSGPAGDVLQRTELTSRQAAIFKSLAVPEPPRYAEIPTPAVTASA
jgi:hypothetical protein